MKIRCVVLIAFALAIPAYSDVSLDCARLGEWGSRGIVTDLAAGSSRLYAADERGLSTFDITQPEAIRRIASVRTTTPSRKVAVSSNAVAVLTVNGVELFSLDGGSRIAALPVRGDSILAAGDLFAVIGADLVTLTVESGSARIVGKRPAESVAEAAALGSDVLVVRLKGRGLFFLDPRSSVLATLTSNATSASALANAGDRLFVADLFGSIRTFDISRPATPLFLDITSVGLPGADKLVARDQFLYATAGERVVVFDITTGLPALHAEVPERADMFTASGATLFVAASPDAGDRAPNGAAGEIHAWNITSNPARAGEVIALGGPIGKPATDGRYAFIADPPMFRVVDLQPSPPSEIAAVELGDGSDHVRLYGDRALVFGDGNVHIVDITQRRAPRWLGMYASLGVRPSRADFAGEFLVEANITSGFHLVDVSDPANARHRDGLLHGGSGRYHGTAGMPGVAYVYEETGFKVVNTTNPDDVEVVGFVNIPWIQQLEVIRPASGAPLLAARTLDALHLLSLAKPLSPQRLWKLDFERPPAMATTAGAIHLVESGGRLHEIDISTPSSPQIRRTFTVPVDTHGVAVAGSKVILTSRRTATLFDLQRLTVPATAPQLTATPRAGRGTFDLTWTASAAGRWTIEVANDPSFATGVTTFTSTTPGFRLGVTTQSFVRVRASSCTASSNVVTLTPDESVAFASAAQETALRFVGEDGVEQDEPLQVRVAVAAPATTGLTLPRAFAVLPHTRASVRRAARRSAPDLTPRPAAAHFTCGAAQCQFELAAHAFDSGTTTRIPITLGRGESVRLSPNEVFPAATSQTLFTVSSPQIDELDIEAFAESGAPLTVRRITTGPGAVEAETLLVATDDVVTFFGLDIAAEVSLSITPRDGATFVRTIHAGIRQAVTLPGSELTGGARDARVIVRSSAPYALVTSSRLQIQAASTGAQMQDALSVHSGTLSGSGRDLLRIENPGEPAAEAAVTLIRPDGTAARASLPLAPLGSITAVLADLFVAPAGLVRVTSTASLVATIGRDRDSVHFLSESSPSRNSAGQRVRPDSARERIEATLDRRVIAIRITETGGAAVAVQLSTSDPAGAVYPFQTLLLAPFEVRQIERGVLAPGSRIEAASTGDGQIMVEAVVLDGTAFPLQ